jgi:membrane protein DedA with SNARE-associated domain
VAIQASLSGLISYFVNISLEVMGKLGPTGVFILMILEGVGLPFPSEIIMLFGGFLANGSIVSLAVYSFMGSIGGFFGNLILYYISLFGGRPIILGIGKYISLREEHLDRVENWFDQKGEWTVFFGRFVPGFRSYMSIPAGIAKMNVYKFSFFSFGGSLIWSTSLAILGFELGKNWQKILPYISTIGTILLIIFSLAILGYLVFLYYRKRNKNK